MSSILDMVREAVTPDVMDRMSGIIGESPAATQKAFGAAVPTVLAGAAERAASPGGAERLRAMISEGGYGGGMLDNLGSLLGGRGSTDVMQGGTRILSNLFGGRTDGMTDALASFTGLRRGSISSVLSLAAPIVMSVLGKQIATRGLDASGLMSLLGGQRSAIASAVPSGLATLFTERTVGAAPVVTPTVERAATTLGRDRFADDEPVASWRQGTGFRAWPLVLAGLAALALIFLLTRGRAPEVARAPAPPDTQTPAAAVRGSASLALPGGRQLSVSRGGFLDQLNTFLDGKSGGEPPKRFVFDDLNFRPGTTELTPQSRATVDSLAVVLTAYPSVQVALEGHTDATGDAAANKKLSLDRAEAIRGLLMQAGVTPERISVVGHGQERPVASNDTEDGRARNRRTELVVLKR